ncbi:MAG TPA: SRPBCC family protein [Candidatus Dormibacteraeota bacterium]|nr:SRPBCC family protein [Candidatus Dormibacteraeota bacterium]
MGKQLRVVHAREVKAAPRRAFELIADLGTSADKIWPFKSQPFQRTAGPLEAGKSEEWHGPFHARLERLEPNAALVWRFLTEGFDGTHGFYLSELGEKLTRVEHRLEAELVSPEGEQLWRRAEDLHERAITGVLDLLAKVAARK